MPSGLQDNEGNMDSPETQQDNVNTANKETEHLIHHWFYINITPAAIKTENYNSPTLTNSRIFTMHSMEIDVKDKYL